MAIRDMIDTKTLFEAAATARQRGDFDASARALHSVLRADPQNPHALNSLGMLALEDGDPSAAEAFFRKAAAADPNEPALWLNVAKAQRLRGDSEGELVSLNSALSIDQRHFMALLRKAELLERLQRKGAAAQTWAGVVALSQQAHQVPPAIAAAVSHGKAYVAEHQAELAGLVDARLGGSLNSLDAPGRRRFQAALDVILGRRRIYTNVCHGIHFPFLPADEFFDRSHFPWLPDIEREAGPIRDELRQLVNSGDAPLRPYVAQDPGTPANKWTPLDNSLDWSAMFLWEYGKKNESLCSKCPRTAAALERVPSFDIPTRAPTAFFSILKPKTRIPPHTGVTNLRAIIHLPLIVPDGCHFRVGGETRRWVEGEAFAFDDTIEHEAINDSDELRAVLIFDVWNPHLTESERDLMRDFYVIADEFGLAQDEREL